ncbi:MAG: chloride channel protein [Candidatus Krumholzibacteriota bacterium]|nr:chloride channel protein [Candidatus Krumholzibacteriota bacterium]
MAANKRRELFSLPGKWMLISVMVGPATAVTVWGFMILLRVIIDFSPRLIPAAPWIAPFVGATLVGGLILRFIPGAGGEGIPSYLVAVNRNHGRISLAGTLLKIPATLFTLGFYGSGGIVGPLARIGSGIGGYLIKGIFRLLGIGERDELRIATICGVGGIVSAIFHSPFGGGIFAVEILNRDTVRYRDLFPSIMTGYASFFTSRFLLGEGPIFALNAPDALSSNITYALLPVAAAFCGAVGLLFIFTFKWSSWLFQQIKWRQPSRTIPAGALLSLLWISGGEWSLNISTALYNALGSGDVRMLSSIISSEYNLIILLSTVILVKIAATSITIGSGMSGGFTGPMIITGMASGALFASLLGCSPGGPEYFIFMACGVASVLGSALNVPLAATVITAAVFGNGYMIPAAVGGALSFILYRSLTIYNYSYARSTQP